MHAVRWLIAIAVAAGICRLFPLFHIVPLKTVAAEKSAAAFNPAGFAGVFWTNQLLPSLNQAIKAETLLPAIANDPTSAKNKYARQTGVGDTYFYFLSGAGRVVSISEDEISLTVLGHGTNVDIALQTGLVFGNALRDGTGLLNANAYPNSQDFNAIAGALNHIVEIDILPGLRERARVGAVVSFAGCVEIGDDATDLKPLKVIPITAQVE